MPFVPKVDKLVKPKAVTKAAPTASHQVLRLCRQAAVDPKPGLAGLGTGRTVLALGRVPGLQNVKI